MTTLFIAFLVACCSSYCPVGGFNLEPIEQSQSLGLVGPWGEACLCNRPKKRKLWESAKAWTPWATYPSLGIHSMQHLAGYGALAVTGSS